VEEPFVQEDQPSLASLEQETLIALDLQLMVEEEASVVQDVVMMPEKGLQEEASEKKGVEPSG